MITNIPHTFVREAKINYKATVKTRAPRSKAALELVIATKMFATAGNRTPISQFVICSLYSERINMDEGSTQ
jgi:hypothetical protein